MLEVVAVVVVVAVVGVEHYILPAPYRLSHQRVRNQHEAHDPSLHSC